MGALNFRSQGVMATVTAALDYIAREEGVRA